MPVTSRRNRSRGKRVLTPWSRIASGPHRAASPYGTSSTDPQIRTALSQENQTQIHIHSADDLLERGIQFSDIDNIEGRCHRVAEELEIFQLNMALRDAKEELETLKKQRDEVTRDCETLKAQLIDEKVRHEATTIELSGQKTQLAAAVAERDHLTPIVEKLRELAMCNVCYQPIIGLTSLSCGHIFCFKCAERWWEGAMIQACPLCRDYCFLPEPLKIKHLEELFALVGA